jgi:hypothetical protein
VPELDPAAPAQPPNPPTASDQAVVKGDYAAFEAAERAALAGKPLAPAPVEEEPKEEAKSAVSPTTPEKPLSRKEREQQEVNDRIRAAVEKATADTRAELAQLRAQLQTLPAKEPVKDKPAASAPPAEKFPDYATYLETHPDATLEVWMDARDDFRDQQRERAARQRQETEQVTQAEIARLTRANDLLAERQKTDPEFTKKLNPRLLELETFADAGRHGRPAGPGCVIAEELFSSESFVPLLEHFTAHPEALTRLEAMPAHLLKLPLAQRISEHARWIVREMGKIEATLTPPPAADEASLPKPKTQTTAPRPPADLGHRATDPADPMKHAVATGDYAAFERLEREKLAAQRRR